MSQLFLPAADTAPPERRRLWVVLVDPPCQTRDGGEGGVSSGF